MTSFLLKRPGRALTIALGCSTILVPLPLLAQQSGTAVVTLDPVNLQSGDDDAHDIVAQSRTTGSKMATDALDSSASVSVVTQKEISERGAQDLQKVLSYTAGVATDDYGRGDDRYDYFRIRGFDAMTLGTYRDGLPVRGFGWTFGKLEPYGLERVEVLKGSTSSLFGLNAPGGLVNAITKTPRPERFGEVYTTFGEGHLEFGTDFGDKLDKAGVWSYRITAKRQDADLGYDYSNDDRTYVAGALTWAPDDRTKLTFTANYSERDGVPGNDSPEGADIDRDTFLGEPEFNRFDTTERSFGYQFSHDFGNGLTLRQNARYSKLDLTYQQVYGAGLTEADDREAFAVDSDAKQAAVDTQLQYNSDLGWATSRTLLGVEYSWIKVNEEALYTDDVPGIDIYDPSYCGRSCISLQPYNNWVPEQETQSAYLQEELTFADRWILTFGGRYDHIDMKAYYPDSDSTDSRRFDAFTKRLGLTFKATPTTSVYASYSTSFQPDIWSLSDDPTEGEQYEAGVKYRPEGIDALFTAAVFDLTQTNVSSQVSPNTYRQIGEVNVKGVELEAKLSLSERLDMTASYSYWKGEITEDGIQGNKGNRPAFVPEQIASVWADYTVPGKGPGRQGDMNFGLGLRYQSDSYADDANTMHMSGRTLVDASFGYQLTQNASLQLNASNLFDKDYVAANYYGSVYYGSGREVTATLRYTW